MDQVSLMCDSAEVSKAACNTDKMYQYCVLSHTTSHTLYNTTCYSTLVEVVKCVH